jgi:DNA excision repair protein ERCC-6-like 2
MYGKKNFKISYLTHVTVFHLLGAHSLEELIYSRQIYKQQLSNIAVSGKMEKRYFEGVQVIPSGIEHFL